MNIITNADVKKFIDLFKVGVQAGKQKELTSETFVIGDEYSIYLEFSFQVDAAIVETALKDEEPLNLNELL